MCVEDLCWVHLRATHMVKAAVCVLLAHAVLSLLYCCNCPPPQTKQVLKSASDKYTEYVAQQLPQGVLEAFSFQSRLWEAKHPGQPLPRGVCVQGV